MNNLEKRLKIKGTAYAVVSMTVPYIMNLG